MNRNTKLRGLFKNQQSTISLTSFLIYSPISIFAVMAALVRQIESENLLAALLIGLIATIFTGLSIFLLNLAIVFTIRANKFSLVENLKFVNLLVCGALRGVIVFYLIEISDFQQPSNLGFRVLSSTANFFFWILLIDRVIDENRRFGSKYRNLISASLVKLAENNEGDKTKIPTNWERQYKEIQALLSKTIEKVKIEEIKQENLVSAAASLREIIDQKVRPLSHRVWASGASSVPRVQFSAIASSSLQNPVIPALPIALSIGLISAVNLTSTFGLTRGIISAFFLGTVFFTYYAYFHKRLMGSGASSKRKGVISLLIPGIFTTVCFYLVNRFYFEESYGVFALILIPSTFFVCCAFAVYEINKIDRENILLEIEQGVTDLIKKGQSSTKSASERVASYLHNALQPELLALSHQLEEAAYKSDFSQTKEMLEKVASRLNRSLQEDLPDMNFDLTERLYKIQGAWRGLINVEIDIPETFLEFGQKNFAIAQIIDEAIANAVRHQDAKSVKVLGINREGGGLRLLISSQGASKPANNPGLGSEWLNRYFGNNWERRIDGEETVLQIDL